MEPQIQEEQQEEKEQYWGMDLKPYCMLIHLSQLSSIVIPGLGFIMPIIMWVANKDKSEKIDMHGRVTVNWVISCFIYSLICGVLSLIIIGVFGLIILFFLNLIFAIIAGIKANNGELWVYPLSIKFLKY